MDIVSFLAYIHGISCFKQIDMIGFFGAGEYPLLFFSEIVALIKKKSELPVCVVDWTQQSDADIALSLKMLFLGMRVVYWFGNIEELDAARKKKWVSFLKDYTGPHLILFYAKTPIELSQCSENRSRSMVLIPETIDENMCKRLLDTFYPDMISRNHMLVSAVYARASVLSLDQVYVLKHYGKLIGRNQHDFVKQWLSLLVIPERSLFTLSQHFFAQDPQKFFSLWSTISSDYPAAFWVVYWSEQLFRACSYVQLMRQKNGVEAKQVAFRLPFSFIQRDWRRYPVEKLSDAHASLYRIDFMIKNGGSDNVLDLFYSRFFQKC